MARLSAAALDHRLRGLIDIRQNLAWHQRRLLRTFADLRHYRALGFRSFSRYCRGDLGMSVTRAWQLIARSRRLATPLSDLRTRRSALRCPWFTSRRSLHGHHVVFRSEGGGGEDDILVTVCAIHHLCCHRLPGGLFARELGASPGVESPDGGPVARSVEDVVWEAARRYAADALRITPPA